MGRARVPVEVRRAFWRAIRDGVSTADASEAVGASFKTGKEWFAEAGGMSPVDLRERSGRYLSLAEREAIGLAHAAGAGVRQIAEMIGRDPSTVSRELRRNASGRRRATVYRPVLAQHKATQRAARPKRRKLAANPRLREEVQNRLDRRFSPEQITADLRMSFPDDPRMRISPESIYRSIYLQGRGELRRELAKCLRTGRALRKPRNRAAAGERRGKIPNMVMISDRPAEAEDRSVPGHWEGDLILGTRGRSAIGTVVERSTRFLLLLHLPHDHTAETVADAVVEAMRQLPEQLRRSLAWDQGKEMHRHTDISLAADLPVYFCDPHSPWQRGTNENTNGLLRQYFPKGSDLSVYPRSYLDFVAAELNSRPRKTLRWKTPAQALDQLLSAPQDDGVATTA